MACLSYFIAHSPFTHDAPTYTKLEWLVHRILSFTLCAHATLRRIQNLNGLSIVFYRSQSTLRRIQNLNGLSIVFYRSQSTLRRIQNLNGLSIVFYRSQSTLRRIQNLNGLSIVFYRSHSAHTRHSDVYIDYRQVWGLLRLAPIIFEMHKCTGLYLPVYSLIIAQMHFWRWGCPYYNN